MTGTKNAPTCSTGTSKPMLITLQQQATQMKLYAVKLAKGTLKAIRPEKWMALILQILEPALHF